MHVHVRFIEVGRSRWIWELRMGELVVRSDSFGSEAAARQDARRMLVATLRGDEVLGKG